MILMLCSGQDLANLRERDTCPIASEVSQAVSTPNTPISSYTTPRRESLGPNPETPRDSEERTPTSF